MEANSRVAALIVLAACSAAAAADKSSALTPVALAVKHGECEAASKLINTDVGSNDRQSAFQAGRLLDEGICMQPDPEAAAHFFARAAELGDRNGTLEFAAKVGLGVGAEQDYERAGELCRAAGVDPKHTLSSYSLGYACTIGGVTGKLLRQKLPTAAFSPPAGASALVEFTVGTRQVRVLSTPHVARGDADVGSLVRHPLVDANREIERAWLDALALAPKPDPARLEERPVDLPVDVDMTLEVPRRTESKPGENEPLFKGDIQGTTFRPHS